MIEKLPNADRLIIEEFKDQEPFTPGNYTQNDIVSMVHKINELVASHNNFEKVVTDLLAKFAFLINDLYPDGKGPVFKENPDG